MASGVVLTKKWGKPDTLLATTSWQLVAGGSFLAPSPCSWKVRHPRS